MTDMVAGILLGAALVLLGEALSLLVLWWASRL